MAYTLVNLIALVVGLAFLVNGYVMVKQGREAIALFVVSVAIGSGLIFVAVFPDVFQVIATVLGLELKARAILVISNLTLFVVATYLFNRIGKLYDRLSRLNEEVSLLRTELEEQRDE
ncbi:DUF2304 domain-containing protein [Halomicroarcula limicola]|uniref:DUF2304 domain-containing protein n=1 Tax=Haloarcula limicola TaxID=1429915 RepID=A0A8J7YAE5_9EURY|nr:DUF2304 domain-containing protein [Halomicroarcula limicola]MBV0924214.1 DUF2304 domain-containing protein [Halomicroarcula limicola]